MASTTNDGGKMTAVSVPTDKAIVTSSGTKTFHLPTERAHDIPSRRPGETFDFMALTGELRNAIYQAVVDTMETTPDNPIMLTPGANCSKFDPMEELAETERTAKPRTNLANCRLGEVSRQIRSEFVPMLMDSLHFRICRCPYDAPSSQPIIQAPIHPLAGMIHHLDYCPHLYADLNPLDEFSNLFDTLLSLRFNGELKIVGRHGDSSLLLKCLDTFCTSMREGESKAKAQWKTFEVRQQAFDRVLLGGTLHDDSEDMTFRFNCDDFLGEHVQT